MFAFDDESINSSHLHFETLFCGVAPLDRTIRCVCTVACSVTFLQNCITERSSSVVSFALQMHKCCKGQSASLVESYVIDVTKCYLHPLLQ